MKVKDFLVSHEEFTLVKDNDFPGLLKTYPVPASEKLPDYYKSNEYISHSDSSKGFVNKLYYRVKRYNLTSKYNLIQNSISGNQILDYGCGTGDLVAYLSSKNMDAFGFEPNPIAHTIAFKKNPKKIYTNSDFLDTSNFDAITLWHVLEHLPNLHQEILRLKNALNPNGKMFVAVPNYESYDATYYKEFWAAYDVPRHLWHFNSAAMKKLFEQFGMIIENIIPMYFDAYYVSMLSEKYKESSVGFLRAMLIGTISNLKAVKTGQYSSLIYQIGVKN